jgi:hypothetical protein
MVWRIACVAKKENIFIVGCSANRAGSGIFFLQVVLNPSIGVELGDLFPILDKVFGNNVA